MSCDGTGYMIGCSGCGVCEDDMREVRANKAAAATLLGDLRRAHHRTDQPGADPWAEPEEMT